MREILFRGKRKDNGEWVEAEETGAYIKVIGNIYDVETSRSELEESK